MAGIMDISQNWNPEFVSDLSEYFQPLFHTKPTLRSDGRAVGLVITGLKDEPCAGGRTGFGNLFRHHPRMLEAFELTRSGDEGNRVCAANGNIADHHGFGLGCFGLGDIHDHRSFNTELIRATSSGLLSSQNTRPRPSTCTQAILVSLTRKRSCSRPSSISSSLTGQLV